MIGGRLANIKCQSLYYMLLKMLFIKNIYCPHIINTRLLRELHFKIKVSKAKQIKDITKRNNLSIWSKGDEKDKFVNINMLFIEESEKWSN